MINNRNRTQEEIDEQILALSEYIESNNKQLEETMRRI